MTDVQAPGYRPEEGAPVPSLPAPEPVPNIAAFLDERELCLAGDPRRRENYKRFLASSRRSEHADYMPPRLDIENVSRCNFRCGMCQVSDWPKGRRAADMDLDAFKRLIDSQWGLVEIKLQGMGEPTMQGDDYFAMIRYARERNIWVRTTTNASLLHLKDNYRKLVDSGVNEIQISIDGADKETFESVRAGGVFERVVDNCRLINAYCAEQGIERTKMWTVVQKANHHQLEDFVPLAARLGFTSMAFSTTMVDWGDPDWRRRNDAQTVDYMRLAEKADVMMRRGEELGVAVRFWSVTSKYSTAEPAKLCPWPFERGYVSSDLRIVPCCIIGNPETSDLGDANRLEEEWNGAAWREFRRAHLEGRIPAVCRSCYED
ncbi:heme biosynthesis protein [Paramagnetospirillum caucaseum]|uniref:Heme biosynthesis protein n=1 Tax=Paramagnetospirillum caucaseum TaxID=1244869 RepID=M3ADF7_9PROT|nr:radical SAM protein [Paramagnetospirillum caucaseum]EME70534.1 heme biosynthesis protein [Paramagnetospirillum caucaseum]